MPEARLTAEEAEALRRALGTLTVRTRTGEVGMLHGSRFVGTGLIMRKPDLTALDAAAHKVGLSNGVRRDSS